jgi:hypothetical protein
MHSLVFAVPTKQCCILLSFSAHFSATLLSLSYLAPYWAELPPSEFPCNFRAMLYLTELRCTQLNYAGLYCATLHPTDLLCTEPSTMKKNVCYATPYGARVHPTDLRCTLLNYTALSELRCTLTEIPPFPKIFRKPVPDCPASVSLVSEWKEVLMLEPVRYRNKETQSGTGMLRYLTEMMNAGMPMPSYGFFWS